MTSLGLAGAGAPVVGEEVRSKVPVISAQDDYFQKLAADYVWQNSFTLPVNPSSVVDSHLISFELPRMAPPNFIRMQDLAVQLSLRLVDSDGNPPADNSILAPCNLFTAAIFRYSPLF